MAGAASVLPFNRLTAGEAGSSSISETASDSFQTIDEERGSQRLSLERLRQWEELGYGMFIHYGMSTFDEKEHSLGDKPSTLYAPTDLNVEQWIKTASDAGMRYVILTAKHSSGHCLWHSKYTDYHTGTSSDKTDVIAEYVKACAKYGIIPGLYYCSWDDHQPMGSQTPSYTEWGKMSSTEEYRRFQWNQVEELLTQYGKIGEVWIDIPGMLPRDYRHKLYNRIAELQPDALIVMNHGYGDGQKFDVNYAWPSDVVTIERWLPNSETKYVKWREIEGKRYYMPGEVCDPIGHEWFFLKGDYPRSDEELLGMYLVSRTRGANFLLNVPPDKTGQIPRMYVDALLTLRKNISLVTEKYRV
jgi:alpha-L-fucosidase